MVLEGGTRRDEDVGGGRGNGVDVGKVKRRRSRLSITVGKRDTSALLRKRLRRPPAHKHPETRLDN